MPFLNASMVAKTPFSFVFAKRLLKIYHVVFKSGFCAKKIRGEYAQTATCFPSSHFTVSFVSLYVELGAPVRTRSVFRNRTKGQAKCCYLVPIGCTAVSLKGSDYQMINPFFKDTCYAKEVCDLCGLKWPNIEYGKPHDCGLKMIQCETDVRHLLVNDNEMQTFIMQDFFSKCMGKFSLLSQGKLIFCS